MDTTKSPHLILGTAGHIDHGKSSLILALTGTDPDRLVEEKQRGITIELGFAQLKLPDGTAMGVVDVPGHERFVRQMIAGSTGIDVALLCIAADDGVMPQTEEHLAVLTLLGIPSCVVALTKTDLVDGEWVEFVADDVRQRLATTPYADAPIVPVSSRTGAGLDELKATIQDATHKTRGIHASSITRMPIDRVFTIKGAGTVVTGTLWSGRVTNDQVLEVLPSKTRARVRSIQEHGMAQDVAVAGNRVALNLAGVSTDDLHPGDFLAEPGTITPTDRFDATITYLGFGEWQKPLESGTRLHIAHGTKEVLGRVLLMDERPALEIGESAFAQIRLEEPLPVMWQDRFVMRSFSPVHVIGGGMVLNAHPRRRTTLAAHERDFLKALETDDEPAIINAAFAMAQLPVSARSLAEETGLSVKTAAEGLVGLVSDHVAVELPRGQKTSDDDALYLSRSLVQKYTGAIEQALIKFHGEQPTAIGITKEALRNRVLPKADDRRFDSILAAAIESQAAMIVDGKVSHPKAGAAAKQKETEQVNTVLSILQEAGPTPPTIEELSAKTDLSMPQTLSLLGILERQGRAVRVGKEFYYSTEALQALEAALRDQLSREPSSVAQIREALGISRKYAIPILEYFDTRGVTRRVGDLRELNVRR